MRGGGALFTEKSLWAQELGVGSLCAAFQTVKTLRDVLLDKFITMFLYRIYCLQINIPKHLENIQNIKWTSIMYNLGRC